MKLDCVMVENRLPMYEVELIWSYHKEYLPDDSGLIWLNNENIKTPEDYNKLLTSIEFWEKINGDRVLIIQHDSGLLRTGIEEFYEYDFIGAPLYHIPFPCMNGGLSLRSPEAMIRCIKDTPYNPSIHGNEDIFMCNQLKKLGGNLPTKEIASKFSVETIYGLGSLGYHAIDKWHSKEKCNLILNQYL